MSFLKKAGICFIALLLIVSMSFLCFAEESAQPSIVIKYGANTGQAELFSHVLNQPENGSWIWMQVPEAIPLDNLSMSYVPTEEGELQVYWLHGVEMSLETLFAPSLDALDFTQTEASPYEFSVQSKSSEGETLWNGWITVSHREKPYDLPEHPAMKPQETEPPATQLPETLPPETHVPAPEATVPVPTETAPPTEQPSLPPETSVPTLPPETTPFASPPLFTFPPATATAAPQPTPTAQPSPTGSPVTLPPTWQPETPPPVTMPPISKSGYGLATVDGAALVDAPYSASIVARLYAGDVIHINGQTYQPPGHAWHHAMVIDTGDVGFIDSTDARFMTEQEIYDYLNRPTHRPTARPTVSPAIGYARITWQNVPVKNWNSNSASTVATLYRGDVVYVLNESTSNNGDSWGSIRTESGMFGYITMGSLRMMTPSEVDAYLQSLRPTSRPTIAPTLNPNYQYAVVRMNNVNFRKDPGGDTIRRVSSGTLARLLADPVYQDGYAWFEVEIDRDIGYLRSDMIDFVQVSPSVPPTPAPTPTPLSTPEPPPLPTAPVLPTARPMTLIERIRASVDTIRYTEYARSHEDAFSFYVQDLNSDGMMELLLIQYQTKLDGTHALRFDAYAMQDGGAIRRIARWEAAPVLMPGTKLTLSAQESAGRHVLLLRQWSNETDMLLSTVGLTLTEEGWLQVPDSGRDTQAQLLISGEADPGKGIALQDYSGLSLREGEVEPEQTGTVFGALLQVLRILIENASEGNG